MTVLALACCFWTLGMPVPASERGPILRKPEALLVTPPPAGYVRAHLDLACHHALASLQSPPARRAAVALGKQQGGDCAIAIDLAIASFAASRAGLDSDADWTLAAEAATSTARRAAAHRNAALYAWYAASVHVRTAIRAGAAFPLEPWIAAGDALARADGLTDYAIDAYENALRASRARELTRDQAAHIAAALAALPGDRAAALRTRIRVGS